MTLSESWRVGLMWYCLAIFLARTIGQVEVALVAPGWLPPMSVWYSGLVPYAVLLPIQIVLLAFMSAIAHDHSQQYGRLKPSGGAGRTALRLFATMYALAMVLRLIWLAATPPHTLLDRGLLPIVVHWHLALFAWLASCAPAGRAQNISDGPGALGSTRVRDAM